MMLTRSCLVLSFVLISVIAVEKYTDKYDNINIKEILQNKALLRGHINCVLGKGKCTPAGKEVKNNLQEALQTGCEKCTVKQQGLMAEIIQYLIEYEIELWNEITDEIDPVGKWRTKYEDLAKQRGIVIPKSH